MRLNYFAAVTLGTTLAGCGTEPVEFPSEPAPTELPDESGDAGIGADATSGVSDAGPAEPVPAEPCVDIDVGDALDFGAVALGTSIGRDVRVTNCGVGDDAPAFDIAAIELVAAVTSAEFQLVAPAFGTLAPGETAEFAIIFEPTSLDEPVSGQVRVETSVSTHLVELSGVGSENTAPVAIASCTVRGSGIPALADELWAVPLDTLDCTGATSYDPDGEIVAWHWEVVARPDGSTAEIQNAESAESSFFIDLATPSDDQRYELSLTVTDNSGVSSAEPSRMKIAAIPDEDIHVQLVWNTPGDQDQIDTGAGRGSDMDLRFRHEEGCWGSRWDCYFGNGNPNWSGAGTDDDPSIDIDDTDGAGPENANLSNPEDGVAYTVGVHYWDPWGFGESEATVRIYLHGRPVFEQTRLMASDNEFWEVGRINWPSETVEVIDRMHADIPTCEGLPPVVDEPDAN